MQVSMTLVVEYQFLVKKKWMNFAYKSGLKEILILFEMGVAEVTKI